ncbi:MAG: glycosyltransferase family 39 protein [Candidatus Peregrinibacteria bacterium]|nr:glycosyltransferase family 39 protein [Candidatus Peregrinibacteria bacterium]
MPTDSRSTSKGWRKILPFLRSPWFVLPLILLLGLVIRFSLAPQEGYGFDVGVNKGWARSAVQLGLAQSYSEQVGGNMLPNYPPFSLLTFASAGWIYQTFLSPDFEMDHPTWQILIKLPAIIADLLTCLVLFAVVRRMKGKGMGLLAALLYALHPAVIFDSAVWGQTDAIFTLFITAGLWALGTERWRLAGILAMIAVLTKMQAVVFLPLFALVMAARPRILLESTFLACCTLALVLLPFALGGALLDVFNVYHSSVGHYANLSSGAYNMWWSLFGDAAWGKQDTDLFFGIMTYRRVGLVLFATALGATLWIFRKALWFPKKRRPQLEAVFYAGALIASGFFVLSSEMHERYLFPLMAVGLPLAFLSVRLAAIYTLQSLAFFFNLLAILPFVPFVKALFDEFPALDVFVASVQFFCLVLLLCFAFAERKPWEQPEKQRWLRNVLLWLRHPTL